MGDLIEVCFTPNPTDGGKSRIKRRRAATRAARLADDLVMDHVDMPDPSALCGSCTIKDNLIGGDRYTCTRGKYCIYDTAPAEYVAPPNDSA